MIFFRVGKTMNSFGLSILLAVYVLTGTAWGQKKVTVEEVIHRTPSTENMNQVLERDVEVTANCGRIWCESEDYWILMLEDPANPCEGYLQARVYKNSPAWQAVTSLRRGKIGGKLYGIHGGSTLKLVGNLRRVDYRQDTSHSNIVLDDVSKIDILYKF